MLSWYLLFVEMPPSRSDFPAVFLENLYIALEKYPGLINGRRDCKCWLDEQREKTDNPFNFNFYRFMKNFFHKRAYEKKAAKIDFLSPATVKYVGWSMHSVQVDDESSRCMRAHLCCGFGSSEVARRSDSSSRYKDTNLQVMG